MSGTSGGILAGAVSRRRFARLLDARRPNSARARSTCARTRRRPKSAREGGTATGSGDLVKGSAEVTNLSAASGAFAVGQKIAGGVSPDPARDDDRRGRRRTDALAGGERRQGSVALEAFGDCTEPTKACTMPVANSIELDLLGGEPERVGSASERRRPGGERAGGSDALPLRGGERRHRVDRRRRAGRGRRLAGPLADLPGLDRRADRRAGKRSRRGRAGRRAEPLPRRSGDDDLHRHAGGRRRRQISPR